MTASNAKERGDLAEAMLPEAAALVVDVHEGSADDVATRLRGLSRHELEAAAVVLAAMVDPDRSLAEALGWVTFDEYGRPAQPPRKKSKRLVREAVRSTLDRTQGVDAVRVERALVPGPLVELNQWERTAAVELGVRRGMSYDDLAERLGIDRASVMRSWERSKERARAAGRYVPPVPVGQLRHVS
ncbi:hypothetical protein [Streptomyces sp. NPDC101145]|uniref:hypothetical protein n=1 Tax=Streptomyces sp. NPDC101145 TaxID=3366112 RepID=UPI0037F425F4